MDNSVEVEEDTKEVETMSDNEKREREKESKGIIASKDKKVKRKKETADLMMFDGQERKVKKNKKNREKDDELVGHDKDDKDDKEREVKRKKKEKRDHMVLLDDRETELEKIEKVKEKRNGRKAHNKDKKWNRKEKEAKDVGEVIVDIHSGNKDGLLVQGKRFSEEEDELIKKAVSDYIEPKQLGDDGLKMILRCKSCPEVKGCWQEIGAALPWRPNTSIYFRAHRLYEHGVRKWTPEEIEYIRKSYKQYGPKWKMMADKLGKCQAHVRSAFQRYQFGNLKKGKWSQDEYQTLFELVNRDLQEKVFEEKKSACGMLKDNIKWETISWELGTRYNAHCCAKWYNQLTSPMVAEEKWADSDDYRLLMVLVELDASCVDEVDWDDLLEHRSGDLCWKRWLQMVRHLGVHGNKTFSEQVEVLSKRYCPDLAQVREAIDARPIVD